MTADSLRDGRPPRALVRVLNPVMRTVLPTPIGRLVRSLALLEFAGRRSGRRFRVPIGCHPFDGGYLVISPAPWRANFAGGHPVTVHFRGHAEQMTGTLDADPDAVARTVQALLDEGLPPRMMGLKVRGGHRVTAEDVARLDRKLIRFVPGSAARVAGAPTP